MSENIFKSEIFSETRLKRDPKKSAARACGHGYPPWAPAKPDAPLRTCENG